MIVVRMFKEKPGTQVQFQIATVQEAIEILLQQAIDEGADPIYLDSFGDAVYVGMPEKSFIHMLLQNIEENLSPKLSYSVRKETIRNLVIDAVTQGFIKTARTMKEQVAKNYTKL